MFVCFGERTRSFIIWGHTATKQKPKRLRNGTFYQTSFRFLVPSSAAYLRYRPYRSSLEIRPGSWYRRRGNPARASWGPSADMSFLGLVGLFSVGSERSDQDQAVGSTNLLHRDGCKLATDEQVYLLLL